MNDIEKPKILIVEDSPANVHMLVELLKDFQCYVAINGKKALAAVESGTEYDLILLDVMMPVLSGFELKQYFNHNSKVRNVPVIFITSKAEQKDIKKGIGLGAVDYITKPFDADDVLTRVNRALRNKWEREKFVDKMTELKA
ncbi:MAG: response regulator [Candidatus Tenebribacter davisii]|nr:response regulator [Candidatus Tenebribacter davisii]